jgi:hypothetical protein
VIRIVHGAGPATAGGLVVALLALVTWASPAAADPCPPGTVPDVDPVTAEIRGCVRVSNPGTPGPPGDDGPGPGTPVGGGDGNWPPDGYVLVEWPSGSSEDDGTPCILRNSRWIPEGQRQGYLDAYHQAFFLWYERLPYDVLAGLADCTSQPGEPGIDPQMVQALIVSQLDRPSPRIDPGRAITGLRSYLDIAGPTAFDDQISLTAPAVTVTIDASAVYRVDWGDGTVETYASSGGSYPDGDITHVYTRVGDHTVTVTPVWTVSWVGGGFALTFSADLAPSTVDLPVGEVQSVRTD